MCGIFGVILRNSTEEPSRDLLQQTAGSLSHRGPDSHGIYSEAGLGMVHTRLSLLDLSSRGDQPFWDDEGRYCLVYNGEIYNFAALREELANLGCTFRSGTDTEVLLQSLIRHGAEATLTRLEGMFAFALYDTQERTLLLARDRFGIKPLVIYDDESQFLFASETKAFRPWVDLKPDPLAISTYLVRRPPPTKGRTFFEKVRIVEPGGIVRLRIGEAASHDRFHRLEDMYDPDQAEALRGMSQTQVIDLIDEQLQHAVQQMLFADAPVGAFCSGGVDSSLVMAMAARRHDNLAIFHADVVGPGSEYPAARQLAEHLGLDLKKVDTHDKDFIDLMPDVLAHYEHPYNYHANSIPFLKVSQLVRENGVKGVLSGEGSDECYLGYAYMARDSYFPQRHALRRHLERLPILGRMIAPQVLENAMLVSGLLNLFETDLERVQFRERYRSVFGRPPELGVEQSMDHLSYHLRSLLHRNDCLGMAASIESRFPFLDEKLVKLSVNLPVKYKIRYNWARGNPEHPFLADKWVIRQVADRYLPRALSRRKKWGFTVNAYARTTIPQSYFEGSFVSDFFELDSTALSHFLERASGALKLKFLMLDVWARVCLNNEPAERIRSDLHNHLKTAG